VVPVARKLSTIGERRQNQCYLFRQGSHRNKTKLQETVRPSSPGQVVSSSGAKHNRRTAQRTLVSFGEKIAGTKVTKSKIVLGSSLSEDIVLRVIIPFVICSNMSRIMRPMLSFRAIKIDKNRKRLSDFPAVAPRALC
jgi:hypothetical protein